MCMKHCTNQLCKGSARMFAAFVVGKPRLFNAMTAPLRSTIPLGSIVVSAPSFSALLHVCKLVFEQMHILKHCQAPTIILEHTHMKLVPANPSYNATCHPLAWFCSTPKRLAFSCKAVSCHAQGCRHTFRPQVVLITFKTLCMLLKEEKRKTLRFWRQFNEKPIIILGCPVCMLLYRCQALASTPSWPWSAASCSLVTC